MAALAIPAKSKLAIARREPNLLVPGRKPTRPVLVRDDQPITFASLITDLRDSVTGGELTYVNDPVVSAGFVVTNGSSSHVKFASVDTVPGALPLWGACQLNRASAASTMHISSSIGTLEYYAGVMLGITSDGFVYVQIGSNTSSGSTGRRTFVGATSVAVGSNANVAYKITGLTTAELYVNGVKQTLSLSGTGPTYNPGAQPGAIGLLEVGSADYYQVAAVAMLVFGSGDKAPEFLRECSADPYGSIFEPANQSPFLISIPGGGGASVTVPAKAFSLTTSAPAVSTGASVAVPAKAFSLTLTAPAIQAGANTVVNVPAKAYALTTAAPGVSTGVAVAVPAKQFSLFATAPAVATGVSVAVPAKAYVITLSPPTIDAGLSTVISAPAKAYSLVATAPSLSTGVSVGVPAKGFSLSLVAPTIATGVRLSIPAKAFSLVLTAPAVSQPDTIVLTAKPEYSLAIAPYRGTLQGR